MKENRKLSLFRLFWMLLRETMQVMPVYYSLQQIVAVVHGVSFGVITWMTQRFFDAVTQAAAGQKVPVLLPGILLGAVVVGSQILNGYHNYSHGIVFKKLEKFRSQKLGRKTSRIASIDFENPKLLDTIDKARTGMQHAAEFQFVMVTLFTFYLPYYVFMAVYLYTIHKLLPIVLLLVFVPVLFTQILRTRIYRDLEKEIAPDRRKYEYYEKTLCGREHLKETRLLGAFEFLKRIYMDTLFVLNAKQWKADKRSGLMELAMKCITLGGYFGILYMLVMLLIRGEITVGAFAAIFASIGLVFGIMEEIICRHIGALTRNLGTIENYIDFLALPERGGTLDAVGKQCDIRLDDVSFAYPGSESNCLCSITLNIEAGTTVAIVGENGAGKSTLMRLISGIYLPTEGTIRYGDTDIRDVKPDALFENTSAVFQKYQKYQMTLRDNIVISDDEGKDGPDGAAGKAGVNAGQAAYPDGYETMLSREFDGVDLSGGQWQRVAIARGYYRQHDLIILDEPTAAIDPIEESRIYGQFTEITRGKTAFIVTHRLGSAKIADRIIVMDGGRVVEDGTHEALMGGHGHYAAMYRAQAKWYMSDTQDVRMNSSIDRTQMNM